MFDLEMLEQMGFCSGIENYSRQLSGRKAGEPPPCLLDYFPKDFLLVIDESHQTVPQIGAMYRGDRSRKETLVEFGFRLPSALDNRPAQVRGVRAAREAGDLRLGDAGRVRAREGAGGGGRADHPPDRPRRSRGRGPPGRDARSTTCSARCASAPRPASASSSRRSRSGWRRTSPSTSPTWASACRYLHSDIDTLERSEIIRDLRRGEFDVLVGINLLREGLDIPEVSLVAILDADKEGFLRSAVSLIQTIGRAARNVNGRVILYADTVTDSMRRASTRRTAGASGSSAYNAEHGITPQTVKRNISDLGMAVVEADYADGADGRRRGGGVPARAAPRDRRRAREGDEARRPQALDFEKAAQLRDRILALKDLQLGLPAKAGDGMKGVLGSGAIASAARSARSAARAARAAAAAAAPPPLAARASARPAAGGAGVQPPGARRAAALYVVCGACRAGAREDRPCTVRSPPPGRRALLLVACGDSDSPQLSPPASTSRPVPRRARSSDSRSPPPTRARSCSGRRPARSKARARARPASSSGSAASRGSAPS